MLCPKRASGLQQVLKLPFAKQGRFFIILTITTLFFLMLGWHPEDLCKIEALRCGAPNKHEEGALQRCQTMGREKEAAFKRWRMGVRKITLNALPAIQEVKKASPGYISFCRKAVTV